MFKVTNELINYCNRRIEEIKATHTEKNTTTQIYNSGQLKAYYHMRTKLEAKRLTIINYNHVL